MPTHPIPPINRRRGAPRGNRNRLIHGAYARPAPPSQPSSSGAVTLGMEIAFLRTCILRLSLLSAANTRLEDAADTLRILTVATNTLIRLIHTDAWLRGPGASIPIPDRLDPAFQLLHKAAGLFDAPSAPASTPGLGDLPEEPDVPHPEILAGLVDASCPSLLSPQLLAELSAILDHASPDPGLPAPRDRPP